MGKAQLEAQFPQPPQLRKLRCALIFYFETLRKLRCGLKSLKIVRFNCAALSIFFFFRLIAQFYRFNLMLFDLDRNIDKCRPFFSKLFILFCLKLQKMRHLYCVVIFPLWKLGCAFTWYENADPHCGIALRFN